MYNNMHINYYDKLKSLMHNEYIDAILETISAKCKSIRTPRYFNVYYLYNIVLVLKDLKKWESLKLLYPSIPYHYKTIQDKHLLWSSLNIYEDAYISLFKKYELPKLKRSANLDLYIDSSMIYNKNGSEGVAYGQNPKKRETKISTICNKDKVIYSIDVCNTIKHSTKKTHMYDGKTIEKVLIICII